MPTKVITSHAQRYSAKGVNSLTCHRLTLEAMVDVADNNIIDHQSVLAWAASLNKEKP